MFVPVRFVASAAVLIILVVTACTDPEDIGPEDLPEAVEPRNQEYFHQEWFDIARQYPGYGGHFYAERRIYIDVYVRDPEDAEEHREIIGEAIDTHPGNLRFFEADYTMAQLGYWYHQRGFDEVLALRSRHLGPGEMYLYDGINVEENRLMVSVPEEEHLDEVKDAVRERGIPEEAVIFEVRPPLEVVPCGGSCASSPWSEKIGDTPTTGSW